MKQSVTIAVAAMTFVLAGIGCPSTATPPQAVVNQPPAAKPADDTPSSTPTPPPEADDSESMITGDLTLFGEALGNGDVKFTWTAPQGLTEANRLILIQGTEQNPVHDGKHNWFRQYYANRAVIWRGLSAGTHVFRICLTENNDHDTCTRYSGDITIEVR